MDIAAGANQTFVMSLTPTASFCPTEISFGFNCVNADRAPVSIGLNTLLVTASATPVPDVIALAATPASDGIVTIPGVAGTGFFAVATTNVGVGGAIAVSADTGEATMPVGVALCQTNPATGQCLSVLGPTVVTTIAAGATPTFAAFVTASGTVPFAPATNRIFIRFKDATPTTCNGVPVTVTRGSTSVAVRTQ